jgi:hypothetical protein
MVSGTGTWKRLLEETLTRLSRFAGSPPSPLGRGWGSFSWFLGAAWWHERLRSKPCANAIYFYEHSTCRTSPSRHCGEAGASNGIKRMLLL